MPFTSFQTTDFRGDSKEAVLAGIIAGSFLLFRLWGRWRSFEPIFGFPSLHPKIPFPAAGFRMVHGRSAAQELGLWTQNYRPATSYYCGFSPSVRRDNQDENPATIRMRMRRCWGDEGRA